MAKKFGKIVLLTAAVTTAAAAAYYYLQKKGKLPEISVKFYAAQILLAIEHLHSQNIVYRDIKPENILIGADGYLRMTDFGLSKEGVTKDNQTNTFCGTPEYLAPEIILGKEYSEPVDWWGFGVLIYEMIQICYFLY